MTAQSVRGAYSLAPISPNPQARDITTDCKPSCCKTPYGHSVVRDHLPAGHVGACKCHRKEAS